MNTLYKYRKVIFGVIMAVLIALLAPRLSGLSPETILNYSPESPWLAALVILLLYVVKSFVFFIPLAALYIAAGLMFPPGWAILLNLAGLTLELGIGWFMGRWLGYDRVKARILKNAKAASLLHYIENNGHAVVFITRLLPLPFPLDLGSMLFGAMRIPFFKYLGFSLFGLSASLIPLTIAASMLDFPVSPTFFIPLGISFAVFAGLFWVYQKWFRKREKA